MSGSRNALHVQAAVGAALPSWMLSASWQTAIQASHCVLSFHFARMPYNCVTPAQGCNASPEHSTGRRKPRLEPVQPSVRRCHRSPAYLFSANGVHHERDAQRHSRPVKPGHSHQYPPLLWAERGCFWLFVPFCRETMSNALRLARRSLSHAPLKRGESRREGAPLSGSTMLPLS